LSLVNSKRSVLKAHNGLTNGLRLSLIEVFSCYLDIDAFMLLLWTFIRINLKKTKRLFAISLLGENKPLKNP